MKTPFLKTVKIIADIKSLLAKHKLDKTYEKSLARNRTLKRHLDNRHEATRIQWDKPRNDTEILMKNVKLEIEVLVNFLLNKGLNTHKDFEESARELERIYLKSPTQKPCDRFLNLSAEEIALAEIYKCQTIRNASTMVEIAQRARNTRAFN